MTATIRPIPTRHPDSPRKVPGLGPFAKLLGIGNPDEQQWRRLGESLLVGDKPMDDLVEWMYAEGMSTMRPMFDRALEVGIDNVPGAPEPMRRFFAVVEATPDWVDQDLLRRGERVYRSGGNDALYFARDVSFVGGYLASGFNKTLLRTGALEKGPGKRFAETLTWAMDVSSVNGMALHGRGYRSTLHVRFIHSMVRRHVEAMPDWRTDEWGLPINQTDMAATLVGALLAPFVGGMAMGIVPSRSDIVAAAHLTRYVGWLIGVEDEWLPHGFRDGVRILNHCMTAITNPDDTSRQLALPMADDPLNWHYRNLPGLRGRIARAQHLSVASTFLGPRAMRVLGLPAYMPPWYPALRIPINLANSLANAVVPGQRDRAAVRGREAQEAFVRLLTGEDAATIGESAPAMDKSA
ncbi:oxygenase MpaB family protein [Nocardia shimofusensis]|uniref:oxygenase MpaB family protein n=1 Tax=Nocardia shimofusensis TaxID=228596 RepID=UPI0008372072|nr:oxygenase MpaB family protein [Nocardia shimofusensis]